MPITVDLVHSVVSDIKLAIEHIVEFCITNVVVWVKFSYKINIYLTTDLQEIKVKAFTG